MNKYKKEMESQKSTIESLQAEVEVLKGELSQALTIAGQVVSKSPSQTPVARTPQQKTRTKDDEPLSSAGKRKNNDNVNSAMETPPQQTKKNRKLSFDPSSQALVTPTKRGTLSEVNLFLLC